MVEVGGKPILWHIMKNYSTHGINEFIICCGYKGYVIKEYFANYFLHMSDVTFDMASNEMEVHHKKAEPWKVTLVDTGENTLTGGRLKRVREYLDNEDDFCFTCGDGLSNIDIAASIAFHRKQGKLVTISAVAPPGRYGALQMNGNLVNDFVEKPAGDGGISAKAIDTNGAGDMFAGAFLYAITSGKSYDWAAKLANDCASRVVAKFGPRLDLEEFDVIKVKFSL